MSARELAEEWANERSGGKDGFYLRGECAAEAFEWLLAKIREDWDDDVAKRVPPHEFARFLRPGAKYGPPKEEPTLLQAARAMYDNRVHLPGNPTWGAPKHFWEALGRAICKHEEEE